MDNYEYAPIHVQIAYNTKITKDDNNFPTSWFMLQKF